jgi:hypothetical protein
MSGEGDEYTEPEIDEVYDWLDDAFDEYYGEGEEGDDVSQGGGGGGGGGTPEGLDVTAVVEWAGVVDHNGRGGERTTHLGSRGESVNLAPVIDAVRAARAAERRAASGPLKSYRAKSWHAQLRQLMNTKRGREAARDAGLIPSRETQRRWTRGDQAPSKGNRAKIAQAYDAARNPHGTKAKQLRAEAAGKLTGALNDTYGVNVRFRDIRDMRFR